MSEKEKKIIRDLADKLPTMTERERGYLEGTIATAAAMSKKGMTDKSKCISCMRCVAVCPKHARKVSGFMTAVAGMAIKNACSVRKECELFI